MKIHQDLIINYHNIREGYKDFLNSWNWELFITFSFNHPVNFNIASKEVKQWLRGFRNNVFKKIKYAGIHILSNPINLNPHAHLLMTSDPRYPRTLLDISPRFFSMCSSCWDNGTCLIENVYDIRGISNYLSKMKNIVLLNPDLWDFQVYRPSLLNQLKKN